MIHISDTSGALMVFCTLWARRSLSRPSPTPRNRPVAVQVAPRGRGRGASAVHRGGVPRRGRGAQAQSGCHAARGSRTSSLKTSRIAAQECIESSQATCARVNRVGLLGDPTESSSVSSTVFEMPAFSPSAYCGHCCHPLNIPLDGLVPSLRRVGSGLPRSTCRALSGSPLGRRCRRCTGG